MCKCGVRSLVSSLKSLVFYHCVALFFVSHSLALMIFTRTVLKIFYPCRSVSRGGVKAAEHAESMLHNMDPLSSSQTKKFEGITDVMPNTYSVNAVITAW